MASDAPGTYPQGMPRDSSRTRAIAGRILILLGVAMWIPYAVLLLSGGEPEVGRFLPFHLAGVIPGALLARWDWIRKRLAI